MNEVQLLKDLKKEALQIRQKINKVQDPKKKRRLIRDYDKLIGILGLS
jgi:hypothetical protein